MLLMTGVIGTRCKVPAGTDVIWAPYPRRRSTTPATVVVALFSLVLTRTLNELHSLHIGPGTFYTEVGGIRRVFGCHEADLPLRRFRRHVVFVLSYRFCNICGAYLLESNVFEVLHVPLHGESAIICLHDTLSYTHHTVNQLTVGHLLIALIIR